MSRIDFEFPPLGPTGEGEPVLPPGTTRKDLLSGQRPLYWWSTSQTTYYVTYQLDRPAVAFRCYYPGGSSPCDQETADRFVAWAKEQPQPVEKCGHGVPLDVDCSECDETNRESDSWVER